MSSTTLYLASASPRRHELLLQINVVHEVIDVPAAPGEDEPRLKNESPLDYVQRTACDKADRAVAWLEKQNPDSFNTSALILTADTTVALGDIILGKPRDAVDATEILLMLSGQTHLVHTAVVCARGSMRWEALSTSEVSFGDLSKETINAYVSTGEPFGKAGAYGIQGLAASFIRELRGSYTGVMGLPLFETSQLLWRCR
jgi:septum formation protein